MRIAGLLAMIAVAALSSGLALAASSYDEAAIARDNAACARAADDKKGACFSAITVRQCQSEEDAHGTGMTCYVDSATKTLAKGTPAQVKVLACKTQCDSWYAATLPKPRATCEATCK